MLERILVPLDGSDESRAVLARASDLLQRSEEVLLVHAVDLTGTGASVATMGQLADELIGRANSRLAEQADALKALGINARPVARVGHAAGTILDVAEAEGATMIAMSTHGRSGLSRWVLGSVAERVLRSSPVPVLLNRCFEAREQEGPIAVASDKIRFARVLVAIDGSPEALQIVPHVASVASSFGSEVHVVRVVDAPGDHAASARAQADLDRAITDLAAAGVSAESHSRHGEPSQAILSLARKKEIDLIMLKTHGRSGVKRWVLGSVTEQVLRSPHAPPLLVVRLARAPVDEWAIPLEPGAAG